MQQQRPRGLAMPFGEHKGELIERLILDRPDHISKLLRQHKLPEYAEVYEHIRWCISIFDSKPFMEDCKGRGCLRPVTRVSVYGSPAQSATHVLVRRVRSIL